jgi:hypothetical protein
VANLSTGLEISECFYVQFWRILPTVEGGTGVVCVLRRVLRSCVEIVLLVKGHLGWRNGREIGRAVAFDGTERFGVVSA